MGDQAPASASDSDTRRLEEEIGQFKEGVAALTESLDSFANKEVSNTFDGNVSLDIPGMLTKDDRVKQIWGELVEKLETNLMESLKDEMDQRNQGGLFS